MRNFGGNDPDVYCHEWLHGAGMAVVTSAVGARLRGTLMALYSSVQSAAMGVVTLIGGLVISRDAQGPVQYFWVNALLGAVATAAGLMLVGRLRLYGAAKPGDVEDAAKN